METNKLKADNFASVILLTDFSDPAKNAIRYAIEAFGEGVEYQLVNSYYARTSSATLLDLNDMLAKESEQGLLEEHDWINKTFPGLNLSVKTHSIFGSPIDAIKKMKTEKSQDIVVMGTKGASGVDAVLFGSVALSIIRATVVPVISIPPSASFKSFDTLVYATDGQVVPDASVLSPLEKFQKNFNSDVTVFSVDKNGSHVDFSSLNLNIQNAHYASVQSEDVSEAVTTFCKEKSADMLVILPKHTGFFDRLFHKSISKELVVQAQLPILSLENH